MKLKPSTLLFLLALGLAAAQAQDTKVTVPGLTPPPAGTAPAALAAEPAKPSFTEAQLVEEFGWFIGKRVGLAELEFSPAEVTAMLKGMSAAAAGKDTPYELEKIGPMMDEFMQKKQQAYMGKLKAKNTAANTEFFNKLKENKAIVELPSGLRYEIVKEGDKTTPKPTDMVTVKYTGALVDGTVFDATEKHEPPTPSEFGLADVIPGWTEGIQKVSKGGKIKLYVPPHLAYGDEGRPGIPPGSTLVFDVELLDIKAGATPPALPAPDAKK